MKMELTRKEFFGFTIGTAMFAPKAAAQGDPGRWFIQGDDTGNLLIIDMDDVKAVTSAGSTMYNTVPIAGQVILSSGSIGLGKDLFDLFTKVFGKRIAEQ